MADYWKSQPRKFCDFCKCWITDNKPSVDFHEKGKRHQENVEKKIGELRKKGQKDYETKRKMDSDFRKMNEAALHAYQKDIARDPSLAKAKELEFHKTIPEPELPLPRLKMPRSSKAPQKQGKKSFKFKNAMGGNVKNKGTVKSWFEGKTETGNTYYWDSESGESVWERPAEGFVSLAEQERQKKARSESSCATEGPVYKGEPYGKWEKVETNQPEAVDLQLPVQKEVIEFKIAFDNSDSKVSFKEKTVSSIGGKDVAKEGASAIFKKRKFSADSKRNVRRKAEED